MKVGDVGKKETMELLFSFNQLASGKVKMKHVRNGMVVFTFNPKSEMWIVTECERPDP